ncbi:MAG: hypothetical protein H7A49_11905 [Akkermansiaceae bacterium]|nr:hypothetical protein [Akkermansiaceae bacterium]MCP5544597.1 hypothetical protein [Akkermansiaceae bacterium]
MKAAVPFVRIRKGHGGFALVVTVALMVLLTLLALGLLGLSSISLRSSAQLGAMAEARANARLSVLLALGELQKSAGDDRRITVDAGLIGANEQPAAVGVWKSWSPKYADQPQRRQPNYDSEKSSRFVEWLVSHPDPAHFATEDSIKAAPGNSWVRLFEEASDGFELSGAPVPMTGGRLAWAVAQENTKAKINVDGPEEIREPNDVLFAQERPFLGLSAVFQQPDGRWSRRAARVTSLRQADLDRDLIASGGAAGPGGGDFTTRAMGLLTNVVDGGLKTDLNLGFEMSDSEFAQASWDDMENPFFERLRSYRNQRPLFEPLTDSGEVQITANYGVISSYPHKFDAAAAPTFDTLRAHYRTARHLYLSQGGPTVFERPFSSPSLPRQPPAAATTSQPRIRPVLDRLLYFLSMWVDENRRMNLVITPVVTLWNPHNVALEMEGAVVYPWMDFPLNIDWRQYAATGAQKKSARCWQSTFLSSGRDTGEGRTREPYFFLEITANGDGDTTQPIHLEPGEVRVFTLAESKPQRFDRLAPDNRRTWRMRPVGGIRDFVTSGGVAVRQTQNDSTSNNGFLTTDMIDPADKVDATFEFTRKDHHYFITMEDAGRITGREPQKVAEVQSHSSVLDTQRFTTPRYRGSEMTAEPKLVGVIESYHRVAIDAVQVADLVCTTNPRQPYVNRYLIGGGTFAAGPHYEASMRSCAAVAGAGLQLTRDGRRAYYGASNSSGNGRTQLAFFEVPRQPVLSIAGLQHADITSSAFGPSNQIGNSWASPYLQRNKAAELQRTTTTGEMIRPRGLPVVDSSLLANEALWDEFFFSGAAPTLALQSRVGSPDVWNNPQVSETRDLASLLKGFIADPSANALRNSAMRLHRGGQSDEDLLDRLLSPAGCRRIAAHLMVDGAFNVNSTSEEAWTALLAGLRGAEFDVEDGSPPSSGETPFPRFRNPRGHINDGWDGYRGLQDGDLRKLAEEIVEEVRSRGPFLSLAEFVNRRPDSGAEGLNGALQAAIDRSGVNDDSLYQRMATGKYPVGSNISPPNTGVGTPGYLTQADVLNSIGPRLTVRSDTFTIRGYGESLDKSGNVVARAWCEAVVQRLPEWVDPRQDPETAIADLHPGNTLFGRRFEIVSFRHITAAERSGGTI